MYDCICSNEELTLQTSLSESPSRWKISFVEWTNFKYIYMYKWLFTTYVSKRLTTWPEKGQNSNNFQSRDPTRYPKTNFEADQERDWESEGGGSVAAIKTVVTLLVLMSASMETKHGWSRLFSHKLQDKQTVSLTYVTPQTSTRPYTSELFCGDILGLRFVCCSPENCVGTRFIPHLY